MFRKFREEREKPREEQEKQLLEDERTRWLTAPIKCCDSDYDSPPSFEELADIAIQRAGPGVEYDPNVVAAYFAGLWLNLATKAMKANNLLPDAVHGLWVILEREDFERRMLWDYLTMQGTAGYGLHMFLAEEMQSVRVIEEVAEKIRRGELRDAEAVSSLLGNR